MKGKLNLVYSDNYLKFDMGEDNPISKNKTEVFFDKIANRKDININLVEAPKSNESDVLLVHTQKYLDEVNRASKEHLELSADTPMSLNTLEAGYYIVGGTIKCLRYALEGKKVINIIGGMHHASSFQASGFCFFNDHAIAIRKLQKEKLIKNAIIYDLDVHAGQGTQEIFYNDPTVFTVSIHQDPHAIYPWVGFNSQTGNGKGEGFNLNVTLPPKTTEDKYLEALDKVLNDTSKFPADIKILLLGVDTYKNDLLGGLKLEKDSFRKIGERFSKIDKLAVLFGGGYSTDIPDLWIKFIEGYLGVT